MTTPAIRIVVGIGEFILLALLTLVAPLFVAIDTLIIGDGVTEVSLTELTQETLLLTSALLFGYGAWRYPNSRGFFALGAGAYIFLFIRELDGFLDQIWHGFWVWPDTLIVVATLFYVIFFCRHKVLIPMSAFIDTKPYFHIMFGFIVVLVFSRIFGGGTLLMDHLNYNHVSKSAIQEGLELFGYVFITYGSYLLVWRKRLIHGVNDQELIGATQFYEEGVKKKLAD